MGLLVLKFFFHPNIRKRTLITSILCGLALFCNFFVLQIYCRPVNYAAAMCSAFFAAIVLMPFLHQKYIRSAAYLLIGSGIPICLYCIIFLADPYERFGGCPVVSAMAYILLCTFGHSSRETIDLIRLCDPYHCLCFLFVSILRKLQSIHAGMEQIWQYPTICRCSAAQLFHRAFFRHRIFIPHKTQRDL